MKRLGVLLGVIAVLLVPLPAAADELDGLLRQLIVGSWAEETADSYGVASFAANGNYQAQLFAGPQRQRLLAQVQGRWWIEGGMLHNVLDAATPPLMPLGEDVVDKIVSLNHQQLLLRDAGGREYLRTRLVDAVE